MAAVRINDRFITQYVVTSAYSQKKELDYVSDFQDYIRRNRLQTTDREKMNAWFERQPLLLLQVYRENELVFDSRLQRADEDLSEIDSTYFQMWETLYQVSFADADAFLYLEGNYRYALLAGSHGVLLVVSFALFLIIFLLGIRQAIRYICTLSTEIETMRGGDLEHKITIRGDDELSRLGENLDGMRLAFLRQLEREKELSLENQTMITEMSHDLRTPLTSLMLYAEMLRNHKYESQEQLWQYIFRMDEKLHQLKLLSDHIFEFSLIHKEAEIPLEPARGMKEVLYEPISELGTYLQSCGFSVKLEWEWKPASLCIHDGYLNRILDNLASNIEKYADPRESVNISVSVNDTEILLTLANSREEETDGKAETNGIGLQSIRHMMRKMRGACEVREDGKTFEIRLRFPIAKG